MKRPKAVELERAAVYIYTAFSLERTKFGSSSDVFMKYNLFGFVSSDCTMFSFADVSLKFILYGIRRPI